MFILWPKYDKKESGNIWHHDEHHQNLFLGNCAEFWKQSDKEKYDLINASL